MKKYTFFVYIAIAVLIFGIIYSRCQCNQQLPPQIVKPAEIVKHINTEEAIFKKKYDSLQYVADTLANKKQALQLALQKSQTAARTMEKIIKQQLQTTNDQPPTTNNKPPTENLINEYIGTTNTTDSLCTEMQNTYELILNAKDQQLAESDSIYQKLRTSFDFAIQQQNLLLKYNTDKKKQIRKKRFGNFIWKLAAASAGAFIIQQQLNH